MEKPKRNTFYCYFSLISSDYNTPIEIQAGNNKVFERGAHTPFYAINASPDLIVRHCLERLFTKHDHLLVAYGDIFSLCWKNNNLHILNNKTEECLCEMPGHWSKPRRGYRYIDCGGETAWLNDCSPELETGPVYFAKYEKQVVILQWSMDKKIFNELK